MAQTKLAVLQRVWGLSSRGSASRARRRLIERAAKLADSPHNQAEAIESIIARCSPVIRQCGRDGLVRMLSDGRE